MKSPFQTDSPILYVPCLLALNLILIVKLLMALGLIHLMRTR